MNYDNEIIRDIADVANRKTPRKLAIADSQKVKNISLDTLKITARELGLPFDVVNGTGEDGEETEYLVVGEKQHTVDFWLVELLYTELFGNTAKQRLNMQISMGKALGYESADILDFVQSDVARTGKCTCCGGTPQ